MKLTDLLDELRNNILYDRGVSTGDDDKLWSTTTLVRYINEAHRRFARRGLVIRDGSTAEVVNVTLETGVTQYTLHPSIIAVISARVVGAACDLTKVGHSALNGFEPTGDEPFDAATAFSSLSSGAPKAFTTDETLSEDDSGSIATVSMRIYPTPRTEDNGTVIKLRVIRMPLDDFTTSNLSAVPEIPSDHHLEMLDWAAYLALRIVDQDAGSPKRAQEFANSFEAHVTEARNLILRKLHVPQRWGFGRGGFSWEH